MLHIINAQNEPVLSVVLSGTTNSTIPSTSVGSQFTVDIRVDNTASITAGISGATYGIIWDPAVLEFVTNNDGACWGSKTILADVSISSSEFDFNQIINNQQNVSATIEPDNNVVLGQVTFQVIGSGPSNITFDNSPSGQLFYLSSPTASGSVNIYPTGSPSGFSYANAVYGSSTTPTPTPTATPTSGSSPLPPQRPRQPQHPQGQSTARQQP